jgi:transposase-like protein
MTPDNLSIPELAKRFATEEDAISYFETIRWPKGPVCPHCSNNDKSKIYKRTANAESKVRVGLWECGACGKQFRATIGTIFEDSHIPLNKWLIAFYLICGAKKGMSAMQLQRHLGLGSYKSAWFMAHRIRHAMQDPTFFGPLKGTVEVDETYVGGKTAGRGAAYKGNKTPVVALVERGGNVRSMVMDHVTGTNLKAAVRQHVEEDSHVYTDEHGGYYGLDRTHGHKTVNHSKKEYARREMKLVVHTNTVEGYFSLLKRGVVGSFHHVSRKHLPLYLSEFDFRYNTRKQTDSERTVAALRKSQGKRLTYRNPTGKSR